MTEQAKNYLNIRKGKIMKKATVDFTFELDNEQVTIEVNIYHVYEYEKEMTGFEEKDLEQSFFGETDEKFIEYAKQGVIESYLEKDNFKDFVIETTRKEFEELCARLGENNARRNLFKNY